MEIKSSLLNSKEFGLVKNSLIEVSEIDHKEDFRVKMLEYINDSADNDDDEFFFDMLEFVRFLNPNSDAVAYTTPEHLIYLNAPAGGGFGEKVRIWDFIYDHECLHQLWDTFGVGDKIKSEGIEYNHYILNIASDCVINDYLSYYRKKDQPKNGITPEYLKEEYGVIYDRKKDTQYTLYLKLLEHKNELEKDDRCQDQCGDEGQEGNSSGSNNSQEQSGKQSSSKGGSSENKSDEEQAQDAAKEAQDAADKAKDAAGDDKDKQAAADKAQSAADKAKKEAEKAKEAAEDGDKDGAKEHANAAKKAAQEAKDAAKEAGVKDEGSDVKGDKGENEKGEDEGGGNGKGQGHGSADRKESDVDLDKIKKDAEAVINKYKEKLSGDIGIFINQCRSSQSLKESGLVTGAQKGVSAWNQKLQQYTSAYVKNKVFKKQREFKRTYQKVKRGSGFIEYGQPIQRGKKIKDDKLLINVAFYVDRSGSMSGCIDEVFKASYIIANSLQKQFGKEKVVDKVSFKMFAFDDKMEEVNWGKKVNARGGTMGFDEILKFIKEKTNDYMINIIITDAEFDVKENEIEKFLKEVNGCVIFVTNNQSSDVKRIANKTQNKTKLFYVQADNDFTVGK